MTRPKRERMTEEMVLGARIRKIRKTRACSVKKLAQILHVTPSVINRIECGERRLLFAEALELCDALSVSLNHIAGLDPE